MALVNQLSAVLQGLRDRLGGRIETGHAPFRKRLDPHSFLKLLFYVPWWPYDKAPSVIGRIRDRGLIVTFEGKGLLLVDIVYSGTHRFRIRGDLTTRGAPPEEILVREDVSDLLARLMPIRLLVVEERLVEYDGTYDPETVTAEEVFDRLDALERLAAVLGPPKE